MSIKSGFVSIIGKPNVGKSTLMNALIGERLSIITNKPQTTRKRILGILTSNDYQIIFLDTPGILNPEYLLQERMLEYVFQSVKDSDVILVITDVDSDPSGSKTFSDERVKQVLKESKTKKILLLNKIDLSNQPDIEKLINQYSEKSNFEKVIPISAKEGFNLENVIEAIVELLPEHPKYFPEDQITDENERFFVTEIIREKVFERYREEIPYSTEVLIEEFIERENAKDYVSAVIVVEKETQKPIILGAKGEAIKKLGQAARKEIEKFLQREVYLELRVKVREKWRSNPNMLKNFGYNTENE
ncbi:MAG: GTPase Era [Ignavibacteriales bacterium]|nr:MAG: GTPase Era [Ignavibacteriales bacterium]